MKTIDLITLQGKDLIIDVSKLLSDEVLYINATKLALQFGKDKYQLRDYFKSNSFLEYEKAISKVGKNHHFKTDERALRFSIKGRYGGTYLHSDLVIVFLRWLNVEFAVKCDMFIKQKLQEVHNDKIISESTAEANKANDEWLLMRVESVDTRNNLTEAIKDFCEYASVNRFKPYKDNKCPYYIKLTNLVYKSLGLKKPKGAKSARDVFSGAVMEKIEYLEDMLINLLRDFIAQDREYHEAFKNIKELINYEAGLIDDVA